MNAIIKYLSAIGAKGGKVKSRAKSDAARRNGAKGGRPRKIAAIEAALKPRKRKGTK